MRNIPKFYCQIYSVEVNFNYDTWNEYMKEVDAMPLTEKEKGKLLYPDPCDKQCFDCCAIVGDRRRQTKNLTPTPDA